MCGVASSAIHFLIAFCVKPIVGFSRFSILGERFVQFPDSSLIRTAIGFPWDCRRCLSARRNFIESGGIGLDLCLS